MADELPQQETQTDWQGNPPPQPTGPPPSWDEIKAAPEFSQLNPNEQITAFNHWRNATVNHASTLPGWKEDLTHEFTDSVSPEHQRLAAAAQTFNMQHPELNEPALSPEGFWGTAGRAFASRIAPAVGTAAGAISGGAAGALATPELAGAGAIPGAIGLGIAGGAATEAAQKSLMGDEWYNRNKAQIDINAREHPVAHQIGTLLPFLVSAWTGAPEAQAAKGLVSKVINEESGRLAKALGGAAERFITGGVGGGSRAGALSGIEDKGQITPSAAAEGAGRGVATLGAVSLFPAMKTILGQSLKGVPDAVAMSLAGAVYDHAVDGQPFDFKKISQETGGSIAPFVLQNALLGFLHGAPLRAKSVEGAPAESQTSKPEIEAALLQRQKDLEAKKAQGTITPDQQKELDDHTALIQMSQGAAPLTPEVTAPAVEPTIEAVKPVSEGAKPTEVTAPTVENQAVVDQVNKGLAAGEQPQTGIVFRDDSGYPTIDTKVGDINLRTSVNNDGFISFAEFDPAKGGWQGIHDRTGQGAFTTAREIWESSKKLIAEKLKDNPDQRFYFGTDNPQKVALYRRTLGRDGIQVSDRGEILFTPEQREAFKTDKPSEAAIPAPTEEQRQAAEAQAKTLPTETLQSELAKPDAGFHDIIQAELDRRASAGTGKPLPPEPAAPTQTLEERIAAKTEAENAKARAIQDVEEQIPADRPFPKDVVFDTRDRELKGKQMWLEHVQNPEKDFTIQDLQKALGRDAGTEMYKQMWGEHEGSRAGRMVPIDENRVSEEVPTQLAEAEQAPEQATPELTKIAEAPVEAATTPHEQTLMDSGITDPKAFLDQVNEKMKAAGKPELTMEDLAAMQRKASGEEGSAAATTSDLSPVEKLQNTQKLAELGFYHNKENPIGEVIKNLAESGGTIEKLVAKLLLNSGVDFSKVKTFIDDSLKHRGFHFGDPAKNEYRISLNPSMDHGTKGIIGTLLHEAYHHVTVWKLDPSYIPNKYEAAAIRQLQGIMDTGRKAAFSEIFKRGPTGTDEYNKFINFLVNPNSEESRTWLNSQPLDTWHRLVNNFDKYYGLANLKEMAAEITNPEFHDFISNLPPTSPTIGVFRTLLHQFNNFLTQLVAGRPVPQMDRLRNYLEAASVLGAEAPRTRGVLGTEILPMMSANEMIDRATKEAGLKEEELPKSSGQYASIMRNAGVPFIGNFLGTHEQLAYDAQDKLAKNPNAAKERLDLLEKHEAGATAEDFHLFRAQLSVFRQEEVAARRAGDTDAARAAIAKANNWMQDVYHKTAQAGKALQAVQGALDINTGDFFDLKSFYKMVYGKEFTPAMEKESKQIVQDTTEARVQTLKSEIKMGQEIAKAAKGTVNDLGEAAKGTRLTGAEKKAAASAGVTTKKDAAGKDTGQLDFGWEFNPADAGRKLSQYLNARFEAKPFRPGQTNLTIREVGQIWKFIKANYLNGTEYVRPDELIKDVAADLGIKDSRIIKEAIFSPKTIRQFSAERYAAQSQQRAIVNATKAWMEQNSKGTALKWASNLWEAPRSLAVIGHVNPSLTHAGSLLFRPSRWGSEIPSIGQAFNASFFKSLMKATTGQGESSQAYHENLMQGVMNTVDNADGENMYAKLTSLGLAAKVGTLDDIGQYNTHLGRIGVAGNRGMDILKALRMDLGAKEYKVLKGKDWFKELDQNNKDQVLREMVSRINSETGTTTAGFTKLGDFLSGRGRGDWRTFLFAPKLEGARWQQMVIDPFRAAGLWLKAGSATPAEKYFRNKVTLRSVELMGTYLGALTANAAILNAIGSDNKINFTDPTRSDWLAFKVNGQTVISPSSFLAPLRLSLSVALSHVIPSENRQPYTDKIINYAMGKVTPTISDIVEIARAKQQYSGRPIEALQNLYESMGVKFSTPKNPKDPISLYEWAATKGPIPLSATVEGWYNAMVDQGSSPELAKTIIGASIALVSSVFAVHQHPTPPLKETNP